jgi:hypothetical protein
MTLTARERNLVFAGLLIAAAVAVYTLIHAPLAAKRAEATGQLASLQAELRREQAKVNQAADLAGALKTARDGAFAEAVQALQFSPALGGTYTVNIYFKREKPGPDGEGARFSSMPGRVDPFTVDGVEEFLRELLRYYPGDLKDPMLPPQLG